MFKRSDFGRPADNSQVVPLLEERRRPAQTRTHTSRGSDRESPFPISCRDDRLLASSRVCKSPALDWDRRSDRHPAAASFPHRPSRTRLRRASRRFRRQDPTPCSSHRQPRSSLTMSPSSFPLCERR